MSTCCMESMMTAKLFDDLVLSERRHAFNIIKEVLTEHECEIGRFVNGTYKTHKEINQSRHAVLEQIWEAMWVREKLEWKYGD